MKLFCVVPFYNEVDYLPGCIASLAQQTDKDFSLILVDNMSNDGSGEIAKKLSTLLRSRTQW